MINVRAGRRAGMLSLKMSTGMGSIALDLIGEPEISSSTFFSVRTVNLDMDEAAWCS